MPGRKPKPIAQQIAEGDPSHAGISRLKARKAGEPKAGKGLPDCPPHLGAKAQEAWVFLVGQLEEMDIDRRPDAPMLEGICVAYERAVKADSIIGREGLVIKRRAILKTTDKNGEEKQRSVVVGQKTHPAVAISNSAWKQVKSFCMEFGLSPVSRTRLSIEKKGGEMEELNAILSRPRERKQPANPLTPANSSVVQ